CGDLNDTPGSYAYAHISEGLNDAFLSRGVATGSTYIGLFPGLRIDFLLLDPSLTIDYFSTEDVILSDHRPLVGGITMQ
ncbi:MAG: endonuclease, partial [Cryomorphaceae bacterium]